MQVATNMTPVQQAAYQRHIAIREKLNNENAHNAQQAKEDKARREALYGSRIVETEVPHQCCVCDNNIPQNTKAWFTPSRIAAKSSRCSDPAFTGSRYTCMKCAEASQ